MTSSEPGKHRESQIMGGVILILLLLLSFASAAQARVASIETTAALRDFSPESVASAFREAVEVAVRGATAMGFSWVQVYEARVLTDMVSVQILATDEEACEEACDE